MPHFLLALPFQKKTNLKNILSAILLVSSLLIFGLLWWNAKIITKPLQQMVARIQQITAKDLHLRLMERKGNDELAQTINYFNQMMERLEVSFNSQKTFIANASHELRNPLTAIMGECEVMQLKDFTSDEYKESIKRVESEIERLNTLVNSLFRLAQADLDISESGAEELNISDELQATINYFEHSKYKGRISFERDDTSYYIKSNKHLLFVALQNIIDNACKYSDTPVSVSACKLPPCWGEPGRGFISGFQITVADKGIGIPLDEKDKIFDTFYRAQNTHNYKGAGIGLSLARKILRLSGAEITVESAENKGTTVSVIWRIM